MQDPRVERRFLAASVLSLAILGASIAWTLSIGGRANDLSHEVWHGQEAIKALRAQLQVSGKERGP